MRGPGNGLVLAVTEVNEGFVPASVVVGGGNFSNLSLSDWTQEDTQNAIPQGSRVVLQAMSHRTAWVRTGQGMDWNEYEYIQKKKKS